MKNDWIEEKGKLKLAWVEELDERYVLRLWRYEECEGRVEEKAWIEILKCLLVLDCPRLSYSFSEIESNG